LVAVLGSLIVPAQAQAAPELLLSPTCIKTSGTSVRASLGPDRFFHIDDPELGFFLEVRDSSGNSVPSSYSDLEIGGRVGTYDSYYTFTLHLANGLPSGTYTVAAAGRTTEGVEGDNAPPEGGWV
jgi:hypothetical protein